MATELKTELEAELLVLAKENFPKGSFALIPADHVANKGSEYTSECHTEYHIECINGTVNDFPEYLHSHL